MRFTRADAVEMYARFCLSRYGELATKRVATRAKNLAVSGDLEGEKIWNEVGQAIQKRLSGDAGKENALHLV